MSRFTPWSTRTRMRGMLLGAREVAVADEEALERTDVGHARDPAGAVELPGRGEPLELGPRRRPTAEQRLVGRPGGGEAADVGSMRVTDDLPPLARVGLDEAWEPARHVEEAALVVAPDAQREAGACEAAERVREAVVRADEIRTAAEPAQRCRGVSEPQRERARMRTVEVEDLQRCAAVRAARVTPYEELRGAPPVE